MARVQKYFNVMHGHDAYKAKKDDQHTHGKRRAGYQIPLRDKPGQPVGVKHDQEKI